MFVDKKILEQANKHMEKIKKDNPVSKIINKYEDEIVKNDSIIKNLKEDPERLETELEFYKNEKKHADKKLKVIKNSKERKEFKNKEQELTKKAKKALVKKEIETVFKTEDMSLRESAQMELFKRISEDNEIQINTSPKQSKKREIKTITPFGSLSDSKELQVVNTLRKNIMNEYNQKYFKNKRMEHPIVKRNVVSSEFNKETLLKYQKQITDYYFQLENKLRKEERKKILETAKMYEKEHEMFGNREFSEILKQEQKYDLSTLKNKLSLQKKQYGFFKEKQNKKGREIAEYQKLLVRYKEKFGEDYIPSSTEETQNIKNISYRLSNSSKILTSKENDKNNAILKEQTKKVSKEILKEINKINGQHPDYFKYDEKVLGAMSDYQLKMVQKEISEYESKKIMIDDMNKKVKKLKENSSFKFDKEFSIKSSKDELMAINSHIKDKDFENSKKKTEKERKMKTLNEIAKLSKFQAKQLGKDIDTLDQDKLDFALSDLKEKKQSRKEMNNKVMSSVKPLFSEIKNSVMNVRKSALDNTLLKPDVTALHF